MENVSFISDNIILTGRFCAPDNKKSPAVCIAHGIPAEAKPIEEKGYPALAQKFCENGLAALVFNMRGTCSVGGTFSFTGWASDIGNAITFLSNRKEVDKKRIWLVGFSGGAAVSVYHAANDSRVCGLVILSCPAVLDDRIKFALEIGKTLPTLKIGNVNEVVEDGKKTSPLKWIDKISPRPLLIVHGSRDTLVKVENAHMLYEKAREPKEIKIVNADHHVRQHDDIMNDVIEWMRKMSSTATT
jgi:alpha/beta superfamily hydrolase